MSVHRRGKGWRGKYELPRDPVTGKRQTRRTDVFRTKREAEIAEAKAKADVAKGTHIDRDRITVGEYLKRWLEKSGP